MPTVFAHALTGSAIAVLLPRLAHRRRLVIALAAVAVLPDADVLGFWLGIPYEHALGHRGFSHSILFAVLVGCAMPWLLHRCEPPRVKLWLAVGYALATASHGIQDAMTDGGLGIGFWLPFSEARSFLPFRPVLTSSLNPAHALGLRGFQVLANEALWIGLPVVVTAGSIAWLRSRARRVNS